MCGRVAYLHVAFPRHVAKDCEKVVNFERIFLYEPCPMSLLTVGLLFIFVHQLCVHLATLKIHSISQTPPNLEQRTSPEVAYNSTLAETRLQVLQVSRCCLHKLGCQYGAGSDEQSGAKWVKYCSLFLCCACCFGVVFLLVIKVTE